MLHDPHPASVIALDRYWAIMDALEYSKRRTAGHAAAMIAIIWLISACISILLLFWLQAKAHEEMSDCLVNTSQISYTIYSICGAFYIPFVLLVILYGRPEPHPEPVVALREALHHSPAHSRLSGVLALLAQPQPS
ncbi:5-hydroxytryptamine receptor 1D [Camelus dromedarius]|uniref:5-hydroxytryptamine receptor 1D n=1 Tax=Camelus dromedarius TaxID=9838 RepID=A0A5N4DLB7_CAMDR|nr:5-hydroxytryptamine receptor 1D [Camelus dromedarius]